MYWSASLVRQKRGSGTYSRFLLEGAVDMNLFMTFLHFLDVLLTVSFTPIGWTVE